MLVFYNLGMCLKTKIFFIILSLITIDRYKIIYKHNNQIDELFKLMQSIKSTN